MLFNKAVMFTDIHFGNHNNSRQFNIDCLEFVKWMIKEAKKEKADAIIFLGDWHHNRQNIHLMTLNYSMRAFEELNNSGIKVYFIPGNHDEMYKDKRDIDSVIIGKYFHNITVINKPTLIKDCYFFPWLIQDEYKEVKKSIKKAKYIFGHFELPTFMMNAMVEMPEHGNLKLTDFDDLAGYAFTGHFHKRQRKGKIWYIGNCFPHSFSDTWDDDRGICILEWDKEPVFKKWEHAPKYKTLTLTDILENSDLLDENTYVKITNDIGITNDETKTIKNILMNFYNPRKIELTNNNSVEFFDDENEYLEEFNTLEEIIVKGLKNIESHTIDSNLLIEIYKDL